MNIENIIKDLDPVTLIEFKNYLSNHLLEYCTNKDSNAKIIRTFKEEKLACDECGCKLHKNGKTKNGVQKYICSGCKKTYSETSNTLTYHSKLPFKIWANVIDNLIDGFSIRRIAEENHISVPTSFSMRIKILKTLSTFVDNVVLSGNTQADEKYFSINLKGTKPKNMPRYSKKRTSNKNGLLGLSHHKICVTSMVDENGNLILKIAGLSKCSTSMLESSLGNRVDKVTDLITDSLSSYERFCMNHNLALHQIPSGCHSRGNININTINNVHSQLEVWLSKFRGVSTRHLQEYLNWFTYIFIMKKRFDTANIKVESYSNIIIDDNYIKSKDIFKSKMPIDLNVAYAEYINQS